jgi:hypothetical protein
VDEQARLQTWVEAVDRGDAVGESEAYRRRLTMLEFQLHHRGVLREPAATAGYLARDPAIRSELRELAEVLTDRIGIAETTYPVQDWPLAVHHRYSRREIMAAIGFVKPGEKGRIPQGGIVKLEAERREILLVPRPNSSHATRDLSRA